MPDAFFQKKRKRTGSSAEAGPSSSTTRRNGGPSRSTGGSVSKSGPKRGKPSKPTRSGSASEDEDDQGGAENIDEMDLAHRYDDELLSEDEEVEETPAEARVRLAKMYLEGLKGDVDENDVDAAAIDADNIASRLQRDVSQRSTHMHLFLSSLLAPPSDTSIVGVRGHRSSVTCALVTPDAKHLITAGKEGCIILWRLSDGRMQCVVPKSGEAKLQQRSGGAQKSSTSGAARRRRRAKLGAWHAKGTLNEAGPVPNGNTNVNGNGVVEEEGEGEEHTDLHRLELGVKEGHSDEIWTLAVSSDGKYLATAGKDKRIGIWELGKGKNVAGASTTSAAVAGEGATSTAVVPSSSSRSQRNAKAAIRWSKALGGHKDGITSLGFRTGSTDLFSASLDRTLKLFDVSQLSYVESFFGHQEGAQHLDVLKGEVMVSVGGRDRTARWWKVREESQLVFRGGAKSRIREVMEGGMDAQEEKDEDGNRVANPSTTAPTTTEVEGSLEVTAMVDEHHFLTGGDTGTLSLWSLAKKKPIFTLSAAHGHEERLDSESGQKVQLPRWITSLACLAYGDVFASGSWDGHIRLWSLDARLRSFQPLFTIPATGFVNSLQILQPSKAAVKSAVKKGWKGVVWEERWRRVGGIGRNGEEVDEESEDEEETSDDEDEDSALENSKDVEEDVEGHPLSNPNSNSISATTSTKENKGAREIEPLLVASLGQEHRLGRWKRIREARNGAIVVSLRFK